MFNIVLNATRLFILRLLVRIYMSMDTNENIPSDVPESPERVDIPSPDPASLYKENSLPASEVWSFLMKNPPPMVLFIGEIDLEMSEEGYRPEDIQWVREIGTLTLIEIAESMAIPEEP